MSETEKPAEVLLTTAANGTSPPKNSGGETITEKTGDKENGIEKAAVGETGTHEEKDEDVKMTDATDVKIGEQDKEGNGGEVETMKGKEEEKEMTEIKDVLEAAAEENNEVAKEKNKKDHKKTGDTGGKSDGAEGKSKVGNEEKGQGFEEKGEKAGKGEESEDKGEETEEKGDGAEEKSAEFDGGRTEENEEEGTRKRRRGRRVGEKGQGKGKKVSGKTKEVLRSPTPSSIDRPVRERRTVERLVEVVEKVPSKAFLIEKGQGTPLKDIPNGTKFILCE
ncbi:hypothetical protein Taro_046714 [Colocasia esculenta]|uniref:Uncharacterized protein n=1 Tax=Colocasia esculenta TaxID=4460 RepID=A0A843X2T9_COLES|nr:hypothetical protein [Colocasia esculenta]